MGTWIRGIQSGLAWTSGYNAFVGLPRGATLLRTHFGWGFGGDSASTANLTGISANLQAMGICTTVGDGTEAVPNARTQSSDQAPPTNRWIYWETRAPIVATFDGTNDLVTWRDSGPQAPVDSKGQVSAKSIPEGDSLNIWASWAAAGDWDVTGNVNLWYWFSILYQ